MIDCTKSNQDTRREREGDQDAFGGGPVFLPRRRMSKLAEELLARPLAAELRRSPR
ncbi:MAG: hypothetical protein AAGC60_17185 [Acidobacteriota bacterium]